MSIIIYIAVMAGITYLIRMIPFTLFRRKIKSRFRNELRKREIKRRIRE